MAHNNSQEELIPKEQGASPGAPGSKVHALRGHSMLKEWLPGTQEGE